MNAICDKEVNGLLLPLPNKWQYHSKAGAKWTCCKQTIKKEVCKLSRMELEKAVKKVILYSSLPLCIQQAILGDEYGNGPHSSGTLSFQRGRSGSAVRFD